MTTEHHPIRNRPHVGYLIGRLDRIVRRSLESRLQPFGVSLMGYTALTVLDATPGLSNAQLARRSLMTPQGMNQVVAVLAEQGLIRRRPDEHNRRVRRIELTDLGRDTVAECSATIDDFERDLLGSLEADDRDRLTDLLWAVVDANRGTADAPASTSR